MTKNELRKLAENSKNPIFASNIVAILLAIALMFIMEMSFGFDPKSFTDPIWYFNILVQILVVILIFTSINSIIFEGRKISKLKLNAKGELVETSRIVITHEAWSAEVLKYHQNKPFGSVKYLREEVVAKNKEDKEKINKRALKSIIGDFTGTELQYLDDDFSKFYQLDDKYWEDYVNSKAPGEKDLKRFTVKQKKKYLESYHYWCEAVLEVVNAVRLGQLNYPQDIEVDNIIYDTNDKGEEVRPYYNPSRAMMRGVVKKIASVVLIIILTATMLLESTPDVKGYIWAAIKKAATIGFTWASAQSNGVKMAEDFKRSIMKRIDILGSALARVIPGKVVLDKLPEVVRKEEVVTTAKRVELKGIEAQIEANVLGV